MRKNQIQGIINDFADFRGYENPLNRVWLKNKFEMNLKTGKINYPEKDSILDFYGYKRKWLLGTIKRLGGKIFDFEEAKVIIFGKKEKISLKYNGKTFMKEYVYGLGFGREI